MLLPLFDIVVFFQCNLDLSRQRGIFLLKFVPVTTVWYLFIEICNCYDSVVFFYCILELLRQGGIFLLYIRTVTAVWYFSIVF